jgi:hypothetical protein
MWSFPSGDGECRARHRGLERDEQASHALTEEMDVAKEVIEAKPIKHAFKSSTSVLRIYLLSCVNYIFVVIAQNVMKIRLI